MNEKKTARLRRARRARAKIKELGVNRLAVNRSLCHISAQILVEGDNGTVVLASASTTEESLRKEGKTGNVDAARKIGTLIAERAKKAGVDVVAFDRSGYKYHGRVKALAEAAREGGLEF